VWDPVERDSGDLEQKIPQSLDLKETEVIAQTIKIRGSTYWLSVKPFSCGSLWRTYSEQESPWPLESGVRLQESPWPQESGVRLPGRPSRGRLPRGEPWEDWKAVPVLTSDCHR